MPIDQKILSALSNPFRLKILKCLNTKNLSVNELINVCQLSQSAVSQHLAKLRDAGIVETQKTGKNVIYSLKYPKTSLITDIVEDISQKEKESKIEYTQVPEIQ